MLRTELGDEADTYVPLVNGGINLSKLRGVMHDTCNSANKVARPMRVEQDKSEESLIEAAEWAERQQYEVGWQDFCAEITHVIYPLTHSIEGTPARP